MKLIKEQDVIYYFDKYKEPGENLLSLVFCIIMPDRKNIFKASLLMEGTALTGVSGALMNQNCFIAITENNVYFILVSHIGQFTDIIKISRLSIENVKFSFALFGKKLKISSSQGVTINKIKISSKVIGMKNQKENLNKLIELLSI